MLAPQLQRLPPLGEVKGLVVYTGDTGEMAHT